jgi:hypothetical protein
MGQKLLDDQPIDADRAKTAAKCKTPGNIHAPCDQSQPRSLQVNGHDYEPSI